MYLSDVCTIPINLAGTPALSLPCGLDGGLPVGLQLMGRPLDEVTLLRGAYAFEQALGQKFVAPLAGKGGGVVMEYEAVIGLEIHVELKTDSKMFCGCANAFGGEPNSKTCPVCLGMPGVLPVLNRRAVELATRFALALGSEIAPDSIFHRKNYFYPDMPKNFQISQYDLPLGVGGFVDLDMGDYATRIGVTRVHLEEDTGKSIHVGESGRIHGADYSLEDFNRAGVPLMEIVSEPDIRYGGGSAGLRGRDQEHPGAPGRLRLQDGGGQPALRRQHLLASGGGRGIRGEGRGEEHELPARPLPRPRLRGKAPARDAHRGRGGSAGDPPLGRGGGVTQPMRTKEYAYDYRYFPEPDLVPLELGADFTGPIRDALPELPAQRRERFARDHGLPAQDVSVLTASKAAGDYFERGVEAGADPKAMSNWMMGELSAYLNANNLEIDEIKVSAEQLAEMIALIGDGTISGKIAKSVFEEMLASG